MKFVAMFYYGDSESRIRSNTFLTEEFVRMESVTDKTNSLFEKLQNTNPPFCVSLATDGSRGETEILCKIIKYTLFEDSEFMFHKSELEHRELKFEDPPRHIFVQLPRFVTHIMNGYATYDIQIDMVYGEVPYVDEKWIKGSNDKEKLRWQFFWEIIEGK